MKYIITESQSKLINETEYESIWLKRRISNKKMDHHISDSIDEYAHELCDRFESDEEFCETVIETAANDYTYSINVPEEIDDEVTYLLMGILKEKYHDYLIEVYKKSCEDLDDEDDNY